MAMVKTTNIKPPNLRFRRLESRFIRFLTFLVIIALSSFLAFKVADLYTSNKNANVEKGLRLTGLDAMTESQLRKIVVSNHLLVYWTGHQKSATYLLDAADPKAIVLTILLPGTRVKAIRASYPEVVTYIQKRAFEAVLIGGGNVEVGGFINADGNSVFSSKEDSKDTYVGIRGRDIELLIFHPTPNMSLDIATQPGRLRPIT